MGMISVQKNTGRVEVRIGCDELIEMLVVVKDGAQFKVGSLISFLARSKLDEKKIDVPPGPVMVKHDPKAGEYVVRFCPEGDTGL